MGRSWRNFFRRGKEEEAQPSVATEEREAPAAGPEEEPSGGWFGRLRQGLRRSRESVVGQLNAAVAEFRDADDEEFWERVEEILIASDVGVPTTAKLVQQPIERRFGQELLHHHEVGG